MPPRHEAGAVDNRTFWWLGVALALMGALVAAAGASTWGLGLAAASAVVLAGRALVTAHLEQGRGNGSLARTVVGGLALLAGFAGPVGGALGAQVFLAALGRGASKKAGRHVLPALGHATALLGSGLVFFGHIGTGGLALAAGLSVLALHAFWTRRVRMPSLEGWEPILLAGLIGAVGAATLHHVAVAGAIPANPWLFAALGAVAAGSGFVTLAVLADPPTLPQGVSRRGGVVRDVLAHGGAAIAVLNVAFLAFSLVAGWGVRFVFGALLAWQAVAIAMEYRSILHADRARRARKEETVGPVDEEVTVVVAACDESHVLAESLRRNLALGAPLRFILVPATKSRDDTVAVAHRLAVEHPGRVRVVEGTTGSKAEDLNLAWTHVTTPLVLILDADETLETDALGRGLAVLRRSPDVGVVQGRKVSYAPDDGALARFVNCERRYSTNMDHPMHAESFGSSHFAGSAALVRREVPVELGGFTDRTMTEDIEFTFRVHVESDWKIAYEPRMVVRESDPADLGALLKQRTRWARGWTECFLEFVGPVVRRREHLGRKRFMGLMWLLVTPVSALWTTFIPAMLVLRLLGFSSSMPLWIVIPMALVVLPSRLVGYWYSSLSDPVIPLPRRAKDLAIVALDAYAWILFGWFVQLHALYLEISQAPRVWYVTGKRLQDPGAGRRLLVPDGTRG